MLKRLCLCVSASFSCYLLFQLRMALGVSGNKSVDEGPRSPVEFTEPLKVYMAIIIESVTDPRPSSMDFDVELLLELYWEVKWKLCERYLNASWLKEIFLIPPTPGDHIEVTQNGVKRFWVPDTYFVEAKNVCLPSKINPPRALKFQNNGKDKDCQMIYKAKETITVGCNFDYHMYPIEVNRCPLNIRSFTYPKDRLLLMWAPNKGMRVSPTMRTLICTTEVSAENDLHEWDTTKDTSPFKGVRVVFKFSRQITNQLITTYIPSILLVIVGFSCFWMSVDAGGERITLTITTLLAVYTQITMVRLIIPPTSYITNIDIWLFATLGFNLLSTLECAAIQSIHYREQQRRQETLDERELPAANNNEWDESNGKSEHFTFDNNNSDEDWKDEPSDPNLNRMYRAIRKENLLFKQFRRRHDQSYTEYCDQIGKNVLIGSFIIFFIFYVVYMLICYLKMH